MKSDPATVLKLRCLFIKMRSLLEVPLLRLGQARSPALTAVSRVYSSALLAFSRRLLQVCPHACWPPLHVFVQFRLKKPTTCVRQPTQHSCC